MKNCPINDNDRLLFIAVLKFLRAVVKSREQFFQLEDIVYASLHQVFLSILEEVASTDINSCSATLYDLSNEIVSFFRWQFSHMDLKARTKFVASPKCMEILMVYTHFKFASDTELAKTHGNRIDCLIALLPLTTVPNLLKLVHRETLIGMISVLVQVIGYSQQNYVTQSGGVFTYKDRRVYRLAVICLRNISRASIYDMKEFLEWGSYWLFDNELQWISVLLDDDEYVIQTAGLGILGNLIYLPGSYQYISQKTPHFVDMALSLIMDMNAYSEKRKEAVLMMNNFIVSFCGGFVETGKKAKLTIKENIDESINILENGGFFDLLEDLLTRGEISPSYLEALSQLLLNLTILNTDFMKLQLMKGSIIHALLSISTPQSIKNVITNQSLSLGSFFKEQFDTSYASTYLCIQCNTSKIIRILLQTSPELSDCIFRTTKVILYLQSLILTGWDLVNQADSFEEAWESICISFDLIAILLRDSRSEDSALLFNPEIGHKIFELLLLAIKQKNKITYVAYSLLARILTLDFVGTIDIDIENLLSRKTLLICLGEGAVGSLLYLRLFDLILFEAESHPYYQEWVHALQCMLGKCKFIKKLAMEHKFGPALESHLSRAIRGSVKLDEKKSLAVYSVLTLIRHICADCAEAKSYSCTRNLFKLLCDLTEHQLTDHVSMELLECIRNIIVKNDENKMQLTRKSANEKSLFERLVSNYLDSTQLIPEKLLTAFIEIMKMLAITPETRLFLMKSGTIESIKKKLSLKNRPSKVGHLLQVLFNYSMSTDGQLSLIQSGILGCVIHSEDNSENIHLKFLLLRNLAAPRECKAHFLSNQDLLEKVAGCFIITDGQNLNVKLIYSCSSFLWALIYDCEKAKVKFKGMHFGKLVRDVSVLLNKQTTEGGYLRADDAYLVQTNRNLGALDKLLN